MVCLSGVLLSLRGVGGTCPPGRGLPHGFPTGFKWPATGVQGVLVEDGARPNRRGAKIDFRACDSFFPGRVLFSLGADWSVESGKWASGMGNAPCPSPAYPLYSFSAQSFHTASIYPICQSRRCPRGPSPQRVQFSLHSSLFVGD
jgi:hypothetical protein